MNMRVLSSSKCPVVIAKRSEKPSTARNNPRYGSCRKLPLQENQISRRCSFLHSGVSLAVVLTLNQGIVSPPVWAEDKTDGKAGEDNNIVGAIKSLFDPNEKTKLGRVLPKSYLKSARELVKTLRESLNEDPKDMAKFRRTADAAKESIRDYLSNWRGQQNVVTEESYVELEKAIRSLANFYSKAGPSAPLSNEIKSEILTDLDIVEKFL